jgi:hypothetical protein
MPAINVAESDLPQEAASVVQEAQGSKDANFVPWDEPSPLLPKKKAVVKSAPATLGQCALNLGLEFEPASPGQDTRPLAPELYFSPIPLLRDDPRLNVAPTRWNMPPLPQKD